MWDTPIFVRTHVIWHRNFVLTVEYVRGYKSESSFFIYIVCTSLSYRPICTHIRDEFYVAIILYLLVKDSLEITCSLVTSIYPIFSGYMRGVIFRVQTSRSDFFEGRFEISSFPLAVGQDGLKAYESRNVRVHWTVFNCYGSWRHCYDGIKYIYRLRLTSMSHSDDVLVIGLCCFLCVNIRGSCRMWYH